MRRLFIILAAAGAALLGVSAVQAGTLSNATLTLGVGAELGALAGPVDFSPTGASTMSTATVDSGSAFAGTLANVPLSTNPMETNAHVVLGANGKINITPAGATVTAPLGGIIAYQNMAGGMTNTLFTIPIAAGVANTVTRTYVQSYLGTLWVTVVGTGWHVGTVTATGLTGVVVVGSTATTVTKPNVTAMGSFNLNANGAGTVTLVSLVRVKTRGLNHWTSASPSTLTLTYVPEPGTLLLLGAGIAGLATVGRRKGNASA